MGGGGPLHQLLQSIRRQWQVYIEAEGEYRTRAENVGQFSSKTIKAAWSRSPRHKIRIPPRPGIHHALQRIPLCPKSRRSGSGYSAGQAMAAMEEVFAQTMRAKWATDYLGHVVPGEKSAGRSSRFRRVRFLLSCSCS